MADENYPRTSPLRGRIINTGGIDEDDEVLRLARTPVTGRPLQTSSPAINLLFSPGRKRLDLNDLPDNVRYHLQDEVFEWVSSRIRSIRDDKTGLEISNLQELNNSPYGEPIKDVLRGDLGSLYRAHQFEGERLNKDINQLENLEQEFKNGDIAESEYYSLRRSLYIKRSQTQTRFRHYSRSIDERERILDLMNGSADSVLHQGESPLLIDLENQPTDFLENKIPRALYQKITDARTYYRYRNLAAKDPQQFNVVFQDLASRGIDINKMPKDFPSFLKSIGITTGAKYTSIINDYTNEITLDSRSTIAAQRVIKAGYQNTADFYKLYGLGGLPLGAQEMGSAILASTGHLAGNEVRLVQGAGVPTFTNASLWERTIDGGWQLSPTVTPLPVTPANTAIRLRPRGFAGSDPAAISFNLVSEPQELHTLNAFKLIDKRVHEDLAWQDRRGNQNAFRNVLRRSNAFDEVNEKYSSIIRRHMLSTRDVLESRGALHNTIHNLYGHSIFGAVSEGARVFGTSLGLSDSDLMPSRAAEEILAGLLYNDHSKDNRYVRMLRTAIRGRNSFAGDVGTILSATAPELMSLGLKAKYSDVASAMGIWANRTGIGQHNRARMAEINRVQNYRNSIERELNANYRIESPQGLPTEDWGNNALAGVIQNGEAIYPAIPYDIDTDQGTALRQGALNLYRRSPEDRERTFRAIARSRGEDYAGDVRNLVSGMEEQASKAQANLRQEVFLQAANLRAETRNPESIARRMNRMRREYPELDHPSGQSTLLAKVKTEMAQEARSLNQKLNLIESGQGLGSEDEVRIALNVHRSMIQSSSLQDEIRRIEQDASLSPKTIAHTTRNLRSRMIGPPASYGPRSRPSSFTEKFMQYLGTPHGLSSSYGALGNDLDHINDYTDFIENAYERNPFVGKTASSVFENLDRLTGSVLDVSIPGYEENYQRLFGRSGVMNLRLRSVSPLTTNINSAPDRVRAIFETVSEMSMGDKERQLAAYLLPDLMEGWAKDPDKVGYLRSGGVLPERAQREALGRARETLIKSNGIHTISQEMAWENFIPETSNLQPTAEDFVRNQINYEDMTINGRNIPTDDLGTYLTDNAVTEHAANLVEQIQDRYGREARIGRLAVVPNTSAMDEIQRLKRVRFLQETPIVGPNTVTSRRHQENMALLRQAYSRNGPQDLGVPGMTVSQMMNATIDNISFNPIVDDQRLGADIFEEPIAELDKELQSRGLSWQMVKDISQGFRPINIDKESVRSQNVIRGTVGLSDQDRWLNSPLARGNRVNFLLRDNNNNSIEEGSSLQALFAQLTVNSRLDRDMADDLFKDESGNPLLAHMSSTATRDQLAEEIYNLAGIDMRVSTPRSIIGDFLEQRVKGIMNDRMDSVYSHDQLDRINKVRMKYGLSENIPQAAEEATEAAKDFYKPMTRIWKNPLREVSRFWKTNRLNKVGMIGAGAFIAAGLLHGHITKDRTEENMEGPPYLPGGNPYQYNAAVGPSISQGPMNPAIPHQGGGVEYTIRATGGMDPNKLQDSISQLLGTTNVSGSNYDYPTPAGGDNTDTIYNLYGQ